MTFVREVIGSSVNMILFLRFCSLLRDLVGYFYPYVNEIELS